MLLENQILAFLVSFFLFFFYLRMFFWGMKSYQLNKSAYKKKKKDETFVQRLLYVKFKEEIPLGWRLFYYFFCLSHFACILVCVVLRLISAEISWNIGGKIAKWCVYFDFLWNSVVLLAFHSRDPLNAVKYERWIKKKRGMPPKNKKR